MLLPVILLATLVLHPSSGEKAKEAASIGTSDNAVEETAVSVVEGKDLGDGYRYHGRSYGRRYDGRSYGGYGGQRGSQYRHQNDNHYGHNRGGQYYDYHHQEHKLVPIKIPYIDQNGCRFPGEPVCDPAATTAAERRMSYVLCLFADENKNLWKKPTFTLSAPIACQTGGNVNQMVATELCNNNKKLLQAIGLIQEKGKHNNKYFHQGLFTVSLDPCFFAG